LIAQTRVPLPAGDWTLALLGNGGLRLIVDGQTASEEWKNSNARRLKAALHLDAPREVELVIEQFRERASQTLALEIQPGTAEP